MNENRQKNIGVGLALGVAIGVAFGAAWDNMGMGLAFGIAIGLVFGYSNVFSRGKTGDGSDTETDESRDLPQS